MVVQDEKDIEKILENKYKEGLKIIKMSKTSKELLEELKEECPHVPEKELVSLFKSVAAGTKMVDSAIIAAAHNMEYNAIHKKKKKKTWLDDFMTETSLKMMKPREIMRNKQLYHELIDLISHLEEKYDSQDKPPDVAIFRRRITTFLKEKVKK
ncbi:MAG: hypothetical protein J7K12_02450 [Thermoplasmata archaeon]|nr:hypothetical protein [Thermoplasmata archaeon]